MAVDFTPVTTLIHQAQEKAEAGHKLVTVHLAWGYGLEADLLEKAGGVPCRAWYGPDRKKVMVDPARLAAVLTRYWQWITREGDLEPSPLRSHFDLYTPQVRFSDRYKTPRRRKWNSPQKVR